MHKIYSASEISLPLDCPDWRIGNLVNSRPYSELLPEPLDEVMNNILAKIAKSNIFYFSVLAGSAVLVIELGMIFCGFINPFSGSIMAMFGFALVSWPAFLFFFQNPNKYSR